jgi:hypothetical protein
MALLLAPVLALAPALAASPAGAAQSENLTFTVTPVAIGGVTIGTSGTGQSVVDNTGTSPIYFVSAHPNSSNKGAEFNGSAGTCTSAVAPGGTCAITVTFTPNNKGLRSSTLGVVFETQNAKGKPSGYAKVDATLSGTGLAPSFTLGNADFGTVAVGQIGSTDAAITNTSSVPLTIQHVNLQSKGKALFAASDAACTAAIAPGASCEVAMTFTPKRVGAAQATLSVAMSIPGTKASHVLEQSTVTGIGTPKGSGTGPAFTLSTLSIGFVTVGTSASGAVAFTNTSTSAETIGTATITRDEGKAFAITGNICGSSVAPGASCSINVSYTPSAPLLQSADLVVTTVKGSKPAGSEMTAISGTGVAPSFTLSTPTYPTTTVGSSSDGQVTVTNTSLVPITLDKAALQGADQSSWVLSSSACASPLAPSGTCSLDVAFAPRSQGSLGVTVTAIFDIAVGSHKTSVVEKVALTGNAVLPPVSVGAPSFAPAAPNTPVTGTATVTNNSTGTVTFEKATIGAGTGTLSAPGDFTITQNTCTTPLAAGASCSITVQFLDKKTVAESPTATLRVVAAVGGTNPVEMVSTSVGLAAQDTGTPAA